MHELSIALSILDIAAEESARRNGATVQTIYVRVGPLSGVVPEALLSAYELAREASPFPDSHLQIDHAPLIVDCAVCQSAQPADSVQRMSCSVCGTPSGNVVSGQELEIRAMEIEESEESTNQPATASSEAHS